MFNSFFECGLQSSIFTLIFFLFYRFYLASISATSETPRTPNNWIFTELRTFSPSMTRPESCSRQFPSLYHFVHTMYTCESIIREIDGETEIHKRVRPLMVSHLLAKVYFKFVRPLPLFLKMMLFVVYKIRTLKIVICNKMQC